LQGLFSFKGPVSACFYRYLVFKDQAPALVKSSRGKFYIMHNQTMFVKAF
jgi:hypothetical protein